MASAMKLRPQQIGACASLPHPVRAHSAPAPLSSLRVAHVTIAGNAGPSSDLFIDLYAQLRQIAQSALRRSGPQLTVSPTTLLHEAYLEISDATLWAFPGRRRVQMEIAVTQTRRASSTNNVHHSGETATSPHA